MDFDSDGDFGPAFETPAASPPMPPARGQIIPQPQIERPPPPPPQPMPPSMMTALARPGPMPPRGIFSNGDPALGATEEIATGHMLGVSLLLPAAGTVAGAKFAGAYGALGGGILGGSLLNFYRAAKNVVQGTPEGDKEALISGTYALIGFIGAGYLLYKGVSGKAAPKELKVNKKGEYAHVEDEDEEDEYMANSSKLRGVR